MCVFLCVFEALLDQLKEAGTRGDATNENVGKMLEDAQRMVKDMENRNFTPQKTAAEKERDEAKKRTILSLHLGETVDSCKTFVEKQITFPFTYSILFSSARLHQG